MRQNRVPIGEGSSGGGFWEGHLEHTAFRRQMSLDSPEAKLAGRVIKHVCQFRFQVLKQLVRGVRGRWRRCCHNLLATMWFARDRDGLTRRLLETRKTEGALQHEGAKRNLHGFEAGVHRMRAVAMTRSERTTRASLVFFGLKVVPEDGR